MTITIQQIAHHRNGISGAPFHAILFRDSAEGNMLGVVFELSHHVAVFNIDKLAQGTVEFAVNSWRGDVYEAQLRKAVQQSQPESHEVSLRQIAIIWEIEDVRMIRPDLTDAQALEVLLEAKRNHDAEYGINWETLKTMAEILFGPRKESL